MAGSLQQTACFFYIDVRALTGCILEAPIAGASPAEIPMMTANRRLCSAWLSVSSIRIRSDGITSPVRAAASSPIVPPAHEYATASIRNSRSILRRGAPMAILSPISAVRSRTETNSMLAMPIAPTMSENMPIIHPVRLTVRSMSSNSSARRDIRLMEKSSRCSGLSLLLLRNTCRISFSLTAGA